MSTSGVLGITHCTSFCVCQSKTYDVVGAFAVLTFIVTQRPFHVGVPNDTCTAPGTSGSFCSAYVRASSACACVKPPSFVV